MVFSIKGHTAVTVSGTPATCTENGLTDGRKCSSCGDIIEEQKVIPAKGHSFTNYVSNNDATCTGDGTKTAKCDNCDETNTIPEENTATGHTLTATEAKIPTCTEVGNTQYWHCSECEKYFSDANGETEIALDDTVIPAIDHSTVKGYCESCGMLPVNEINFPDENFRNVISSDIFCDNNQDGLLSPYEIENINRITASSQSIENLTGIEIFTNLQYLECPNNTLTELDLSSNKELMRLYCQDNQLTSLNLNGCTNLEILNCSENNLAKLDLSNCTNLQEIYCSINNLTELDLSVCTNLNNLICTGNQLTELDLSACTNLRSLNCTNNQLTDIIFADNKALYKFSHDHVYENNKCKFCEIYDHSHKYIDGKCEICGAESLNYEFYYDNSSTNWENVYCYIWYDNEMGKPQTNAAWPGLLMEYNSETGYYYYQAPENTKNPQVIFNNGSGGEGNQTADLAVPNEGKLIYNFDGFTEQHTAHTYKDGKCTFCGDFEDGVSARLAGHSISLSGNIGVNFFMELDEKVIEDTGAYMQFTLPDGGTSKVMVSDAQQETVDGKTYYVFPCEVAAKDVSSEIKAQIVLGNGTKGTEYTYTVEEYATSILENSENYDEKTLDLVNSMMGYSDSAMMYFNGETVSDLDPNNSITAETLSAYEKTETGKLPEGITYYGSSLLLESETTLRHYFKAAKGTDVSKYHFTGNKGNYYYMDIADISAGSLGTAKSISIGGYTITASPMSYAYTVLANDTADENLKILVKALYLYAQAAEAYIK